MGRYAGLILDLPFHGERGGVTRERARRAFESLTPSSHAPWVENLLIIGGRRDPLVPSWS
jgi:hypothetical protein